MYQSFLIGFTVLADGAIRSVNYKFYLKNFNHPICVCASMNSFSLISSFVLRDLLLPDVASP